jgi:hypothetical protein
MRRQLKEILVMKMTSKSMSIRDGRPSMRRIEGYEKDKGVGEG